MKKLQSCFLIVVFVCLMASAALAQSFSDLNLKLPFPSPEKWMVTCSYQETRSVCSTHRKGIKDEYALDFNHYKDEIPHGTPDDKNKTIIAAASGVAKVFRGKNGGYGNYVLIHHGNGFVTRYAHLNDILVNNNQWVWQGEPIGLCGNTGGNWGEHLHFVLYKDGKGYKPEPISGHTGIKAGESYKSTNVNLYETKSYIDFDETCRGMNPLVERFRNPATGKIEIDQSPADNRVYYYKNALCDITFYAAYNLIGNDVGGCLTCDDDSGSGDEPGEVTEPGPKPKPGERVDLKPDFDIYDENGKEISANHDTYTPKTVEAGQSIKLRLEVQVRNDDTDNHLRDEDSKSIEGPIWYKIDGITDWILIVSEESKVSNLDENEDHVETEYTTIPNYPGETVIYIACVDGDDEVKEVDEGDRHKIKHPNDDYTNNCSRLERLYIAKEPVEPTPQFEYEKTVTANTIEYQPDSYSFSYSGERSVYTVGETIQILSIFHNVYFNHQVEMEVYFNDEFVEKKYGDWQDVGGSFIGNSYLFTEQETSEAGIYRFAIFISDGQNLTYVGSITREVVGGDMGSLFNFHSLETAESFQYNPDTYLYDFTPKTSFTAGDEAGIVLRVDDVHINHMLEVRTYLDSVEQGRTYGDWHDVQGSYLGHSNLAYYLPVVAGNYVLEAYVNDGTASHYVGELQFDVIQADNSSKYDFHSIQTAELYQYNAETYLFDLTNPKTEFGLSEKSIGVVLRVDNVYVSNYLEIDVVFDGQVVKTFSGDWNDIAGYWGHVNLAKYFVPAEAGNYTFKGYINDGIERFYLGETQAIVVDDSDPVDPNPDYQFHSIQTVESFQYNPETWLYDVTNPKTRFVQGEQMGVVARVDNVYINHKLEVDVYIDKTYIETIYGESHDDVEGSYMGYSNLAFYQETQITDDYDFELFINTGTERVFLGKHHAHVDNPNEGQCGPADETIFEEGEEPHPSQLCDVGESDNLVKDCDGVSCYWEWYCLGIDVGNRAYCSADINEAGQGPESYSGSCGPAQTEVYLEGETPAEDQMCSLGEASQALPVCDNQDNCRLEWICYGINGGNDRDCDAAFEKDPPVKPTSYDLYASLTTPAKYQGKQVCKMFKLKKWITKTNGKPGKEEVVNLKLCATDDGAPQLIESGLEPGDYFLKVVGGRKKITYNGKTSKKHKIEHLRLGEQYEQDVILYFE